MCRSDEPEGSHPLLGATMTRRGYSRCARDCEVNANDVSLRRTLGFSSPTWSNYDP
jgi:hypothetical protein